MKAAVIPAFLSGKLIGNMIAISTAPNTKPQIMPSRILDIFSPVIRLLLIAKRPPVNQLIGTVSTTPRQTVRSKYAEENIGSTQDRTSELQEMCARQHTVNINVDSQSGNVIIQMRRACRAQNLITCFVE